MTDQDLHRILRSTLNERAETVTTGPQWDGGDEASDVAPSPQHRRRWLAPLAAAAVVLAVAGGAIAVRHDDKHHDSTPTSAQLPVPTGMRAVDALGVEIFVPLSMSIDGLCGGQDGVNRPAPARVAAGACPYIQGLIVTFADSGKTSHGACVATVELARERGCVTATPGATESGPSGTRQATDLIVVWPRHEVQLSTARAFDEQAALQIIRSAHAVPIDRHGCAAARNPIEAPGQHDPADVGGAPAVPDDRPARSMGVCWYSANRLVASATLGATAANTVLHGAPAAKTLFTSGGPACAAVDHSDATILAVHYAGGGSAQGILRLAGCPGRSSGGPGGGFVATLSRLAAMPLTLGYPPRR